MGLSEVGPAEDVGGVCPDTPPAPPRHDPVETWFRCERADPPKLP